MSKAQKTRVLFLIHTLGGGGAEKALVNLVRALPRDRFDITVETVIDTGRYRSELPSWVRYETALSIPLVSKGESGDGSGSLLANPGPLRVLAAKAYASALRLASARTLYRHIVKDGYDVEVAFLEGICAKAISGSASDALKLGWVHVDISEQRKSHSVWRSLRDEEDGWEAFDRIVAVSEHVRSSFCGLFPSQAGKTAVCHNILDVQECRLLSGEDDEGRARKGKGLRICSVGRLNRQKGYDRLVEAAAGLKREGLEFSVEIVGTGTARDELTSLIEGADLQGTVELLGYRKNPLPLVAAADLFVAPSRAEGLSTAVAEALALGVPVLATDCSGMRELLGDSERGLIVENSTEGIREGLRSLMSNQEVLDSYRREIASSEPPLSREAGVREFLWLLEGGR
ncbi:MULTISPECIES: glycosyltransferase [unclassified Adlercreutzia]|uniref:glycosyltransferase n=1 Tax=unclassified Adlercreutzia TaxID=2636013 RepID=UPI0013EC62E8|nr:MULTISPECIES: glycosyltransferase [unclassified Adlercreutzia]